MELFSDLSVIYYVLHIIECILYITFYIRNILQIELFSKISPWWKSRIPFSYILCITYYRMYIIYYILYKEHLANGAVLENQSLVTFEEPTCINNIGPGFPRTRAPIGIKRRETSSTAVWAILLTYTFAEVNGKPSRNAHAAKRCSVCVCLCVFTYTHTHIHTHTHVCRGQRHAISKCTCREAL